MIDVSGICFLLGTAFAFSAGPDVQWRRFGAGYGFAVFCLAGAGVALAAFHHLREPRE